MSASFESLGIAPFGGIQVQAGSLKLRVETNHEVINDFQGEHIVVNGDPGAGVLLSILDPFADVVTSSRSSPLPRL